MFEDMGSQSTLVLAGLVLLGGMSLTVLYFICKAAWRHMRRVSLIVLGLLPGLAIGYLYGKDLIHVPKMPALFVAGSQTPKPASTVVIRLEPTPPSDEQAEESSPPQQSDQLENLKPALTEEDILPVEPEEIAAAQGVTQPVAPTPNTPEEITEPETANPDLQEPDDQLASPEGQNTAFLPRPKPSQQTSAPSEPQADPQQPASAAPQTLPVQNEPVELTEEERLKQERLADAEDYISVGRLIIEDHPGGAVVQYQKALDVYKEYGTEQQLGNAYHELGLASLRAGELDDATKYTLTALKTGQQLNDQLMITRALTNLGFIYMNKRDPANALIYYNQALAEAEGARPSLALAMLQENIAYAYGAEGKKAEAVAHLSEALSIAAQLETDEDPELKEAVDALVNRVNTNIKDYR